MSFGTSNDGAERVGPRDDPNRYVLAGVIGDGRDGQAYRCLRGDPPWQERFVIKISKNSDALRFFQKEIEILGALQKHPNIVSCVEHFRAPRDGSDSIHLVLEEMDGDLIHFMAKHGTGARNALQETTARSVFLQVAKGLNFAHFRGVAHRDLKPDNILCSDVIRDGVTTVSVKLADFGSSKQALPAGTDVGMQHLRFDTVQVGTLQYMAPEVYSHQSYDKKVDLWSLGVVLFAMLQCYVPDELVAPREGAWKSFDFDTHVSKLKRDIANLKQKLMPEGYPKDAYMNLIFALVQVDPDLRPSARECQKNAWVVGRGAAAAPEDPASIGSITPSSPATSAELALDKDQLDKNRLEKLQKQADIWRGSGAELEVETIIDAMRQIHPQGSKACFAGLAGALPQLLAAGIEDIGGLLAFLADSVAGPKGLASFYKELRVRRQKQAEPVFLSRAKCAAILAGAFFGLVPLGNVLFDLLDLFEKNTEKVLCIMCYFNQVRKLGQKAHQHPLVVFERVQATEESLTKEWWAGLCDYPLKELRAEAGYIENFREELQASFSNSFLGLHWFSKEILFDHQADVLFTLFPECAVGSFLFEAMDATEAIKLSNIRQYSYGEGWSQGFYFAGPCRDSRGCEIVAIDALKRPGLNQYTEDLIVRELVKVHTACHKPAEKDFKAFVTGNWGSGSFGGDSDLKTLIQWLASSAADRDMFYLVLPGDERRDEHLQRLTVMSRRMKALSPTCASLYAALRDLGSDIYAGGSEPRDVFEQVLARLSKQA